jgi:hypothetical protein
LQLLCSGLWLQSGCYADGPAFDLSGPKVDVHVKRGEVTLPIGEVPNLLAGDRLWIHPDLPESQSTHYVLIVAFLRGATNPPPPEWFTRVETWNRDVRSEGVFVTVPAEAQQALIFLAPETGGDFSTLRAAVRGRPGAFVRATQDLQAASWDRMRLDAYLAEVKVTSQTDPSLLKTRAEMAARSLGIKLDKECFDKPTDQQAPCLVQHTDALVLDDANAQSLVTQLTSGSTADLMNQISYSNLGRRGRLQPLYRRHRGHGQDSRLVAYGAFPIHSRAGAAENGYAQPAAECAAVVSRSQVGGGGGAAAVGPGKPPPLHPVNPAESFCAEKPGLVLPAEGAPIVFSTQLAYDLTLHIEAREERARGPAREGRSVSGRPGTWRIPRPSMAEGNLTGVLRGKWGFDNWEGPRFHLHAVQPGKWTLAAGDQSALVVGREDTLHLEGESSLCVDRVEEQIGDRQGTGTGLEVSQTGDCWRWPYP